MINKFNNYSKENNLNITLHFNYYSRINSTNNVGDYESQLDILFNRHSQKYDIIFYDNIFSRRYGPHLLNLKELLPNEHINLYSDNILSKTSLYKDKLVGLPVIIDSTVLYYNHELLNKYNKTIPKTWDELLNTSKYILKEEHKANNTNVVGYNGLFSYTETGTCSLYEFIYSFRNSINEPFPEITSSEAIKALTMIKRIKDEISSDDIFQMDEQFTLDRIYEGNFIFLKLWYYAYIDQYKFTVLPGDKEGISGSIIGGYNVGINKYIDEAKRNAAITAYSYITSKEMQKDFVMDFGIVSGIFSLYNDEEICSKWDCSFFRNLQFTTRPTSKSNDYISYSKTIRDYVYQFLYGDKSESEVLNEIDNITKVFDLTLNTSDSIIILLLVILSIILSTIMLLSLTILYIKKYASDFKIFPKLFWFMVVFGSLLSIISPFLRLGEAKIIKCKIEPLLISIGFFFNYLSYIYMLIIYFPIKNKISQWVELHKHLFILLSIVVLALIISFDLVIPYDIDQIIVSNNKKYHKCVINNQFGHTIDYLKKAFYIIITIILNVAIFIEWNIKELNKETRLLIYEESENINKLLKIQRDVKESSYINSNSISSSSKENSNISYKILNLHFKETFNRRSSSDEEKAITISITISK
ncbi:periplasmic binding protein-like II [Neocallimastix sp. 'constans']